MPTITDVYGNAVYIPAPDSPSTAPPNQSGFAVPPADRLAAQAGAQAAFTLPQEAVIPRTPAPQPQAQAGGFTLPDEALRPPAPQQAGAFTLPQEAVNQSRGFVAPSNEWVHQSAAPWANDPPVHTPSQPWANDPPVSPAPQSQPNWMSAPPLGPNGQGFRAPGNEVVGSAARFAADPAIQANAISYVQQRWQQLGQAAMASEGQAIRAFAKGISAFHPDQQPEKDPRVAIAYLQTSIPPAQRAALESKWRQEYLQAALPQAIADQQAAAQAQQQAANEPQVGRVAGIVNKAIAGTTDVLMKPIEGGVNLFYALGSHSDQSGLHGVNPNQTPNEHHEAASMGALQQIQQNIEQAYPGSTAGKAGGFGGTVQQFAENGARMLPALLMTGRAFQAGGIQKALALSQIGSTGFADSFREIHAEAKAQGLSDSEADSAALGGGFIDALANTYLMKFGAIGRTAEGAGMLRRVLTLAAQDAIAQGGVGGAQQLISEGTQAITTGKSIAWDSIFNAAMSNAVMGAGFGIHRGMERPAVPGTVEPTPDVTRQNIAAGEQQPPAPSQQPRPISPAGNSAQAIPVPESVRNATPTIDAGPQQGQPVPFANDLDKARYVAENFRGPIQRDALNYLHSLASAATGNAQPAPQPEAVTGQAAGSAATSPQPVSEPKPLPRILDDATPKYRLTDGGESRGVPLEFDSPTDKAVWLSTLPTRGKLSVEADMALNGRDTRNPALGLIQLLAVVASEFSCVSRRLRLLCSRPRFPGIGSPPPIPPGAFSFVRRTP